MKKFMSQRSKKAGFPPGTLVYLGNGISESTSIEIFDYNDNGVEEWKMKNAGDSFPQRPASTIRWINADGLGQVEVLEKIGGIFALHPLVMEDILNTGQRPKMEEYGGYIFIVAKMLYYDIKTDEIISEQQSIILGSDFVISIGEKEGDVFNPIRDRLRSGTGRVRKMGADYLAYSILDSIVDNYFAVLEKLGEKIELAEEKLVDKPNPDTLQNIHRLKREMLYLHKSVWPLREVAGALERGESALISDSTQVYLRDVYDHIIQAMDTTEVFRDMLSGMLEIYLSSVSNRMNEIMKVLTIISTIFIPLTFVVGIYGMNFKYMPELNWRWGYLTIWSTMVVAACLMITYFKRKKWF